MATNVPRWSLPTGVNPIYGDWDPYLPLPPSIAAIELGLVEGPVLEDHAYITDYSGPSPDHPGAHRYRGLADALDPDLLDVWRSRLVELLESLLAPGECWYLFVGGRDLDPDDTPEGFFVGRVFADGSMLNGTFLILEVPAGELRYHADQFGSFDGAAGLIAPAGTIREVLSRLTLADALPTGQRYRPASPFHVTDTAPLERLLAHGRLFVEETDNGTRLRLFARTEALPDLRERLAQLPK